MADKNRVVTMVITVDTEGNKTRGFFTDIFDENTKTWNKIQIKYNNVTPDERHALLHAMDLV